MSVSTISYFNAIFNQIVVERNLQMSNVNLQQFTDSENICSLNVQICDILTCNFADSNKELNDMKFIFSLDQEDKEH